MRILLVFISLLLAGISLPALSQSSLLVGGALLAESGESGESAKIAEREAPPEAAQKAPVIIPSAWQPVQAGLDWAEIRSVGAKAGEAFSINALRIDPEYFDFVLLSSAWMPGGSRPLSQWAANHNLVAAINAAMYLPDGVTSTAFMRSGEKTNNATVARRYGSFFVAGLNTLQGNKLPRVDLLDKTEEGWQERVPLYDLVVQNFRLLTAEKKNLWPKNGNRHSIAAVASDAAGRIYFLHCRATVTVHDFVQALLAQPVEILQVEKAMYVEGGAQATMLVESPALQKIWRGAHPAELLMGGFLDLILPNVLGIVPRQQTTAN